jgi:hypothetical protein
MNLTDPAWQQLTESNTASLHQKQLHRIKTVSLAQLIMARWPVTEAREEKAEEEEEKHTHQTPRRMPGRHGGAVPTRPARGYLGMTSPSTPGAPHLGASTGVHTHHKHQGSHSKHQERTQRGIGLGGDRSRRNPRGNQPRISSERKRPLNPVGGGG